MKVSRETLRNLFVFVCQFPNEILAKKKLQNVDCETHKNISQVQTHASMHTNTTATRTTKCMFCSNFDMEMNWTLDNGF